MDINRRELCDIGQKLWDSRWMEEHYSVENFDKYVDHISDCKQCQDGLGARAILNDMKEFIDEAVERGD